MREYAIEGHGARMGIMKGGGGGGEIVQVEGGHIIRSTGRKDRHSKVYTSKGPRDRRVRLSATTAIQFYDVQDRLGFDRPSKAVDWLIKKAKSSIDRLADLPPWNPSSTSAAGATVAASSRSGEIPFQEQHDLQTEGYQVANTSSFISFTGYSVPPEMVARATHQTEDLGLSLHPLQLSSDGDVQSSSSQAIFVGTTPVDQFEPGCGHYPRLMGWGGDAGSEENRGGSGHGFLMSDSRSSALMMVNPQRGTLQSSFTGGFNESMPSGNHHHNLQPMVAAHQSSFLGARYGSESLTPFYYPALGFTVAAVVRSKPALSPTSHHLPLLRAPAATEPLSHRSS